MEKNIIVLRSVYPKSNIKITTNPVRDKKTKQYPNCVKAVDSRNDLILTDVERNDGKYYIKETDVFVLKDGTTFDLDNPVEAATWEAVKNNPLIADYRKARDENGNLLIDGNKVRYGRAELYVERPGEDTKAKVSKRKKIKEAYSYIIDASKDELLKYCKIMGRNMENAYLSDIEDYLLSIAEKDPERIINLITGEDSNLRLTFIDAKRKSVIYSKNKLYLYGDDVVLGPTDESVISWMKRSENKNILDLIRKDTYPEYFNTNENDN